MEVHRDVGRFFIDLIGVFRCADRLCWSPLGERQSEPGGLQEIGNTHTPTSRVGSSLLAGHTQILVQVPVHGKSFQDRPQETRT